MPLLTAQGGSNPDVFGLLKLLGVRDGYRASSANGACRCGSCGAGAVASDQGGCCGLCFDLPALCL